MHLAQLLTHRDQNQAKRGAKIGEVEKCSQMKSDDSKVLMFKDSRI